MSAAALAKIAVLTLSATGVDTNLAQNLSEVLLTEVANTGRYQVIGSSDIKEMVGFEAQRQLAACDEGSCLAELGGALGVDRVLTGNIGKLEDVYLLNLKIIDMKKAQVVARTSAQVEGGASKLLGSLKEQVTKLFAQVDAQEMPKKHPDPVVAPATPPPAGATPAPAAALEPGPVAAPSSWLRVASWVGVGVGTVGLLLSAASYSKQSEAQARYDAAVVPSDIAAARLEADSTYGGVLSMAALGVLFGGAGAAGLVLTR